MHDDAVADESHDTNEFNFFANETWLCIEALILAQVSAIQLFCIDTKQKINPRSMNTYVVEWYFGDGRQMVGGSTNSCLRGSGAMHASRKPEHAAPAGMVYFSPCLFFIVLLPF